MSKQIRRGMYDGMTTISTDNIKENNMKSCIIKNPLDSFTGTPLTAPYGSLNGVPQLPPSSQLPTILVPDSKSIFVIKKAKNGLIVEHLDSTYIALNLADLANVLDLLLNPEE